MMSGEGGGEETRGREEGKGGGEERRGVERTEEINLWKSSLYCWKLRRGK